MLDVLEKPGNLFIHPRPLTFQNEARSLLSFTPWRTAVELNFIADGDDDDDFDVFDFFPLSYKDEDERHSEVMTISSVASVVEPDEPP